MKTLIFILFSCCLTPKYFAQHFFGGINTSFYADDFPPDVFGTLNGGYCWKHFSTALELTNCMGYRPTSFQLMGLAERLYFRRATKVFNGFLEARGSRQIAGRRVGTPMEYTHFLPVLESSNEDKGDRFRKADFQGSLSLGLSISIIGFQLYSTFGVSKRSWSSYKTYDVNEVHRTSRNGFIGSIGLNYFIGTKMRSEDGKLEW